MVANAQNMVAELGLPELIASMTDNATGRAFRTFAENLVLKICTIEGKISNQTNAHVDDTVRKALQKNLDPPEKFGVKNGIGFLKWSEEVTNYVEIMVHPLHDLLRYVKEKDKPEEPISVADLRDFSVSQLGHQDGGASFIKHNAELWYALSKFTANTPNDKKGNRCDE